MAEGQLHFQTPDGTETTIAASQLDLQRTVNENARVGLTFSLKPTPAGQEQK